MTDLEYNGDKPVEVDVHSVRAGSTGHQTSGRFARLRALLTDSAELFALWFTANFTLLPISTGMSGPLAFGLGLSPSSVIIILSILVFMLPVAWIGMAGPKTGMRQIIQTRYFFGYYLALVIAILQLATLIGYSIITSIVGGQTLAALSDGSLGLNGAIAIITLCAVPISFMGYQVLHYFETYSWIPSLIAIIIAIGNEGHNLSHQAQMSTPSARQILGFTALCASLSLSWAGFVSDFSVYISPNVPRIFAYVYAGYCIPSILLLILGAAIGGAVSNVTTWREANDVFSVGGVMFSMVSSLGGFGQFVAVLMALSVVGLNSCSLYSLSISVQSLHPLILRVPRYVHSVLVSGIVVGVAIAASSNLYDSLSNFLAVVGYWTAGYTGIALTEHVWFRKDDYASYDQQYWNMPSELPTGVPALAALVMSFGLVVPSMNTAWYTGWFAARIGDIGIEVGVCASALLYFLFRIVELRLIGR